MTGDTFRQRHAERAIQRGGNLVAIVRLSLIHIYCEPQVRQSAKVQFGDYQANGVMAVAKKLGMAPRQLAEQVLSHLEDVYKRQVLAAAAGDVRSTRSPRAMAFSRRTAEGFHLRRRSSSSRVFQMCIRDRSRVSLI